MKLYLESSHLYIIGFSHKKLPLKLIGKLYLDSSSEKYKILLEKIGHELKATEIMHLNTCNRSEFYIVSKDFITKDTVKNVFTRFFSHLSPEEKEKMSKNFIFKKDETAVKYLMEVASSLQSMVVGEREIITQVRNAYEHCKALFLTGDLLRLVMKKVIETGKQVFAETDIAKNPVSIASLAARKLISTGIPGNAKVTVIGSGVTIQTFMKYFYKENYQYTFISRKEENSKALQIKYGGSSMSLSELKKINYLPTEVLVICTASPTPIVNKEIFNTLFVSHPHPVIVDLSNPSDINEDVMKHYKFEYITIHSLKKQARENLTKRKQSILDAKTIIQNNLNDFMNLFRERCVENIIKEIPTEFKEYKNKALNEVFKKKLEILDHNHKEVIYEILDYIEGKYNAITYRKLKSILLQ